MRKEIEKKATEILSLQLELLALIQFSGESQIKYCSQGGNPLLRR